MDFLLALIIGLIAGIAIGLLGGLLVRRRSATAGHDDPALVEARHEAALEKVRSEGAAAHAQLREQLATATAVEAGLREQIRQHERRFTELTQQQRRKEDELAERAREEHHVLEALAPVKETLESMQQKVATLESQRTQQYGALSEQLNQARLSDEQLRSTTESLASALRNNSTRGVWGEAQLRRIVEVAGLTQYVDFDVQQSISSDAGSGRPDMVVRLPGKKSIAIDAKVPLEHYLEASQIPFTATGDDGARRTRLMEQHVKAVRGHIDALARKSYWAGLETSPEFVIAFIPSESLLSSALEADPAILDYSFNKRVALASPVNLWAVLKTVAYAWQQQAVSDEAKKLFDLGNTLYARLGTLAGHAESLRKAIDRTVDSYNKFANSLETRVLVTARQFPGIDETKVIDEATVVHEAPRKLTAPEMEKELTEGHEAESADDLMEDADEYYPHLLAR